MSLLAVFPDATAHAVGQAAVSALEHAPGQDLLAGA